MGERETVTQKNVSLSHKQSSSLFPVSNDRCFSISISMEEDEEEEPHKSYPYRNIQPDPEEQSAFLKCATLALMQHSLSAGRQQLT